MPTTVATGNQMRAARVAEAMVSVSDKAGQAASRPVSTAATGSKEMAMLLAP